MTRRSGWPAFAGAAAVGVMAGWFWARRNDRAHRHNLFAAETWRRFAALGWLAAEDDPEKVAVLQDYLTWETVPMLQRRGRRILSALERHR